ncbi:MAG TPA: fibronectin type III domain-containing protein, partial [Solirubrobacterales bacterium]
FFGGSQSNVDAYGTGPLGCESPPLEPPEIAAQYAISVGREEAILKAQINPVFFPDATYFVEYGTGKCSEGGCGEILPMRGLTSKSVNKAIATAGVILEGLEPGTTYHYRFVAQSSGGGPVFGEDPDGKEGEEASFQKGVERTFRTFSSAGPPLSCTANQAFRTGFSAELPDCRAYEMVSPLEKGNADVALWIGKGGSPARRFEIDQSATSGDMFTFTSTTAFADPEAAPFYSQYLAERGGGGWASESISPPRTESPLTADGLTTEFQGLSANLCMAWLRHNSVATLADGAIEKYLNLYRRENCSDLPSYEALSTVEPPNRAPDKYDVVTGGFSTDGTHSIFTANDSLHADAPMLKEQELLLYEHTPEGLRFVCYLPNGSPSSKACAAGTGAGPGGTESSVHNAISADGSRIFWTAFSGDTGFGSNPGAPGQIYARINGEETVEVSGSKSPESAWYWTAADDGSKAIFEFSQGPLKDQLYEFDVATETATLIAGEVDGPMGASEDASRIYFASKEDLDGGGPANTGAHNLYLYEADEADFSFIMALAAEDIRGTHVVPAPIDDVPFQRAGRVSADGQHATFTSVASPMPNGYDNLDAVSGEPVQEVYRYDAEEGILVCVSCNPTGARPAGESIGDVEEPYWVAARIQGWEALQHAPRVISEDGSRVFFESREALVARDTNGAWDVYQWEEAGRGSCDEGTATFDQASGGCIDLISAGKSPANSVFLDADASGEDVFIGTQSSLISQDYGLNDVYDARIGGGFTPPATPTECEGEACQSPPPPPPDLTPASAAVEGEGNVTHSRPKRCKRRTHKVKKGGKVRCVRKSHRSHRKTAR